ncbi:tyrosine-type recombinase/integrase [Enterobacter cloacae]
MYCDKNVASNVKRKLPYTYLRAGVYYLQVASRDGSLYRRSLLTDSFREATNLMTIITPHIYQYKRNLITLESFDSFIDALLTPSQSLLTSPVIPLVVPSATTPLIETKTPTLTLAQAWNDFKHYKIKKGDIWNVEQAKKNERSFESLLALLGDDFNVYDITRKTMDRVMESIEGLPDARKSPYNKMSVKERLECDDIPEEQLIGASTYNAHIKIFNQFFNTYLIIDKQILSTSPMDGIKQKKENSRYGVYTKSEIKRYINHALKRNDSMKWIILLLIYTGARRGEIAKLKASQVKFDTDCKRYYLHIAEDGNGKTENATREVALHADLIEYGFVDFVKGCNSYYLFPDIASTSLNQLTQEFITIRDDLNIALLDKDGARRAIHSLRHTFITYASGWMKDSTHLQHIIGHSKTGLGVTKRYIHNIPLESLLYVIDRLAWN